MAERETFPCGHLMFYHRAIKTARIAYFQRLTGANPEKVPSWCAKYLKASNFPDLLHKLLVTPASYLHRECWHL